MAIGYYNFGNIQAGNQQVVNSLAGLGQQIAGAINTHAATQSAQAMLPMLQNQYQQGMAKIAGGDPNGMADVYGAAVTASQNPLLAPFAAHAVSTAQSANINSQHMLRTLAYQQGKMASLYGQYGSSLMNAPAGMNPNWQGKQSVAKPLNQLEEAKLKGLGTKTIINQINNNDLLYGGGKDKSGNEIEGIGSLAQKIQTAFDSGKAPDASDIRAFASKMSDYKQAQGAYGNQAIQSPQIEAAYQKVQSQIPILQGLIEKENAKGAGHWYGGGTDAAKVGQMQTAIEQLGGNLKLPNGKYITPQAIQKLRANPNLAPMFEKQLGLPAGSANQFLNSQGAIDNSGGQQVAETGPEAADEAEAVGGGSEEETSPSDQTMVA